MALKEKRAQRSEICRVHAFRGKVCGGAEAAARLGRTAIRDKMLAAVELLVCNMMFYWVRLGPLANAVFLRWWERGEPPDIIRQTFFLDCLLYGAPMPEGQAARKRKYDHLVRCVMQMLHSATAPNYPRHKPG